MTITIQKNNRWLNHLNEFIEKIQKKIKNIHFNITQEKENIEIKYFSDASTRQNFINELKSKRKLDIIKGFTTKGVHHDDFLIYLNDKQVNLNLNLTLFFI